MSKVGKDNKAITVIISAEAYDALKDWAELKDWSLSQAARNLIVQGLKGQSDEGNEQPKSK